MSDDATSNSSKTSDEQTQKSGRTTSSTSPQKDGSIVFTTRSAKDIVEISDCDCNSNAGIKRLMPRDWSCRDGGTYYCPGCNEIKCGSCIGASQEAIFTARGDDYEIRWACLDCNTYVFEMSPIVSAALAVGLPIPIEEDDWGYSDEEDPDKLEVRGVKVSSMASKRSRLFQKGKK